MTKGIASSHELSPFHSYQKYVEKLSFYQSFLEIGEDFPSLNTGTQETEKMLCALDPCLCTCYV